MTGVEGYVESAGSGLIAGINAARLALGQEPIIFPFETALGSMARYITEAQSKNFQPMNVNFGIFLNYHLVVVQNQNVRKCMQHAQ